MQDGNDRAAKRPSEDSDDADSDLEELQGDIAKFDESVRQFLASHHGATDTGSSGRGGPRGRGARGPRKAAKPRGDITARLAKVNQAFLSGDYDRALDLAFEVIRINAETHQAWTALSSTFAEIGDTSKALSAMVYAAHLRPKDVAGWLRCASYALDTAAEDEASNLHTARLCYSAALRAEPHNLDARTGKASVSHRQGHLGTAVTDYEKVLKRRPGDIDLVRRLAEACMDTRHAETAVPTAIAAYQRCFRLYMGESGDLEPELDLWYDVGVFVEMYAYTGQYLEAIRELKSLARWLLGRGGEKFWDQWQDDDREWDLDDHRRSQMPHSIEMPVDPDDLNERRRLPPDLRARLAIYRFRLEQPEEALHHLSVLQSNKQTSETFTDDFPYLAFDLAASLAQYSYNAEAKVFLDSLRDLPGDADPAVLLELGRCNLALGDASAAEECFLAAIDADEMGIEPRIELANMYERAKEGEEALILAAEAMAIREAQGQGTVFPASSPLDVASNTSEYAARHRAAVQSVPRPSVPRIRPMIPRRYRPKRLADPTKRRQEEQAHAVKLAQQYQIVTDLKRQIAEGQKELIPTWMASANDLIDDFRSLKRFYTWDRYLNFLGSNSNEDPIEPRSAQENDLSQLYQRLARNVAPAEERSARADVASIFGAHQGITFDQWLELFLDHAIALAIDHRQEEAYRVCESARDSTVFQSAEHNFSIHVAWSVCAIYSSDESKAITIARHLMRDMTSSDGSRLYALLANLCQSPISWYTSGPAQKFILRQIKTIDAAHASTSNPPLSDTANQVRITPPESRLDICLLMLYGHILFTSTSYTFALGYFLRARSIDPNNALVNLSLGLAYVHYGLKRQSANRQYILLQGQSFLTKYASIEGGEQGGLGSPESNYNIGRLFQLLGISHLATEYYSKALRASEDTSGDENVARMAMVNYVNLLILLKHRQLALALTRQNLVL